METENLNDLDSLGVEAEQLEHTENNSFTPDAPVAVPEIETSALLFPLFDGLFTVITPAWDVSKAESKMLADAWGPVIDKYFPNGFGVEGAAILATVAVIGPRLKTSRKKISGNVQSSAPGSASSVLPTVPGDNPDGVVNDSGQVH